MMSALKQAQPVFPWVKDSLPACKVLGPWGLVAAIVFPSAGQWEITHSTLERGGDSKSDHPNKLPETSS